MNVLMIDPTRYSDCQDEGFAVSREHQVAVTLHTLSSSAECLQEMTLSPEYRDEIIRELSRFREVEFAMQIIKERIETREAAEI
jgi:hypothetical protein